MAAEPGGRRLISLNISGQVERLRFNGRSIPQTVGADSHVRIRSPAAGLTSLGEVKKLGLSFQFEAGSVVRGRAERLVTAKLGHVTAELGLPSPERPTSGGRI